MTMVEAAGDVVETTEVDNGAIPKEADDRVDSELVEIEGPFMRNILKIPSTSGALTIRDFSIYLRSHGQENATRMVFFDIPPLPTRLLQFWWNQWWPVSPRFQEWSLGIFKCCGCVCQ